MLLSAPKGKHFECELCGKPAAHSCPQCKLTFYCSADHQTVDWNGVHVKVCPYVASLRTVHGVLGSEEERAAHVADRLATQRAVIEIGKTEATRALLGQKFQHAIPGALLSLRTTIELYGDKGIEVVPPYLLLAQATTGLKKYKQAEEYLSLAKWSVLKNPHCSDALKSQLYRNFGTLYISQGQHATALHHFANSVYYSSLAMGPEHVDTTPGYYQMGLIFKEQGQLESALSVLDKVADIWYRFLSTSEPKADAGNEENGPASGPGGPDTAAIAAANAAAAASTAGNIESHLPSGVDGLKANYRGREMDKAGDEKPGELDELKGTEAAEMLEKIILIREQHLGVSHTATGEAHYILSLILAKLNKIEKALERMQRALAVYEDTLGADHATTLTVRASLTRLEKVYFAYY
eukprot:comp19071_c0_seq1/m.35354 comp19071_c0_seq1/g.35354  ORF comp19071_c0_seq1/g.35354 comp19071_c0_seq1/m.35354 type:complete len:409 (-) comp19071_c0_seq1:21-1247(-)